VVLLGGTNRFDVLVMAEPTELINPLKRYNDTTSAQVPDK